MKFTFLALGAVACATAPSRSSLPSEKEIKTRSHEFLEALYRNDAAAIEFAVSTDFLRVEDGHVTDRQTALDQIRRAKPNPTLVVRRTWEDERVHIGPDSTLFVGKATEIFGANEKKGGQRSVGWYTLQWAREGSGWRIRLSTWYNAGPEGPRGQFNEIYRSGLGYRQEPNRLLVDTVKERRPGTALDVAMGQGRNGLHLASQGWKVTGIDISDEGIRIAREEAIRRKVNLDAINIDIDQFDFGDNRWDLVTMIYALSNTGWIEKIKPSLRPGGLLVIEDFAPDQPADGFGPGKLAKQLGAGFEILRDEVVEDEPDWGADRARLVRFVARKR